VLLKPDGQAQCSFPMPGPGIGNEVWFAGDIATEGVVAEARRGHHPCVAELVGALRQDQVRHARG
jgi:hypothetical protein